MSTYTDASLIYYPSGYKASKAYSLKPTDGSGDLDFTRASTATRVNEQGLIEGVRTNLLTYSEQFDNAAWSKLNTTFSGDTLTANSGTSTKFLFQSQTTQGLQNIYFDVEYVNHQFLQILVGSGGSDLQIANFDILNKVLGTTAGATINSKIEDFGTFVRISISLSPTNKTSVILAFVDSASAGRAASSSSTGSVKVYRAQNQSGDIATEYIPTTTTAVSVGMLADVPRIDYTGGNCGKLLLESQRTNLALYSEQFDNVAWTKSVNTAISANATTSPDGTQNADTITWSTSGSTTQLYQVRSTTGTSQTLSLFVKYISGSGTNFLFSIGTIADASINLTFTNSGATLTGAVGVDVTSYKIEDYGNNWFRVSFSANYAGAASEFSVYRPSGTGTDVYAIYGAQLESNTSYATSYIPTLASSVTRLADAASKTGISSLIGQTEGTLFADVDFNGVNESVSQTSIFVRTAGANTGYVFINFYQGKINVGFRVAGSTLFDILIGSTLSAGRYKIAFAYKSGDIAFYVNGSLIDTRGSTFGTTSFSEIYLGGAIGNQLGDGLNQAQLYTTRLSNAELATLTTL